MTHGVIYMTKNSRSYEIRNEGEYLILALISKLFMECNETLLSTDCPTIPFKRKYKIAGWVEKNPSD